VTGERPGRRAGLGLVLGRAARREEDPRRLRVLVGGQHAGAISLEDGHWIAGVHGLRPSKPTYHETAEQALRAVLRSSWGRRLGARAGSRIFWTDTAARAAVRTGGTR